tara:strand:+ start:1471 stop:1851 length:381 start_codon:yes stop_codon:yes gene_type:complete
MMSDKKTGRNLPLLLIAVAVIGLGALLLNRWLARQPVEAADATRLAEQFELNTQSMQEQLAQSVASKATSETQARLDSPLGQALFRKCAEWTDFYENHPDETTRTHRDQSCSEFREYVNSGTVPEK